MSSASPDRSTAPDVDDLHRQAVERWAAQRRQAFLGFLIPTVICWAIWVMSGLGASEGRGFEVGFPWPAFVMLGTGAGLARVLADKRELVAQQERRLAERQRLRRDARDPGGD